jgi:hypothetical protein
MATYTDPYMFNIVLNSQNSAAISSPNVNNKTYLFNWTNLPEGRYEVTFSYRGLNNGDLVASDSPQVFVSLSSTTYQATTTETNRVSQFMGSLQIVTHDAGQAYFTCNIHDNPPIFLPSRPNGAIVVRVLNGAFSDFFNTIAGSGLAEYVMCLSFKKI